MKKLLKYAACLAILVMVVVLFTGCDLFEGKVTGGGWFMSGEEGAKTKCTFGFVAQGAGGEYKGQFQFNDHADPGQKIHADVVGFLELFETYAEFVGEYGEEKYVKVSVLDLGDPGASPGDYIKIWIDTLPFGPPTHEGVLGGGNLKVHKEK
jgi:hypothetical protein